MPHPLSNLQPQPLWDIFQEICEIPHPSGKLEKIIDYVKNFGEKFGLETSVDEVGNVLIRKPATPGMENRKVVVLQTHLDMVPQKNNDTAHDFEKDPIDAYVDGEWVTAEGTTLGADNGIGMAATLAILASNDIPHGPLEALFTIDEEVGLVGAFEVKPDVLKGDILLNLDTEEDPDFYIGCAGGMDSIIEFPYETVELPADMQTYQLTISGLKGGHSGADIHLGRGNANKIIDRILWKGTKEFGLRLSQLHGGSLPNAIPREAIASIAIPQNHDETFKQFVLDLTKTIRTELATVEPGLKISIKPTEINNLMDEKSQAQLLNLIYSFPNGVLGMCADIPDLVETSSNFAVIKSEDKKIAIITSQRSSVDSIKQSVSNMIDALCALSKVSVKHVSQYPGWKPNVNSPILKTVQKVYEAQTNEKPNIKAIHAGLECGLIGKSYPEMEMVSFGPTIKDAHSPDEKVSIKSVMKFWNILLGVLKNIDTK